MCEPTPFQRVLLDNHHAFTELHRGTVVRRAGAVRWESESPAFCSVLLQSPSGLDVLDASTRAVRTFPWSEDVEPELERRSFRRTDCLRYMSLRIDVVAEPLATPEGFEARVGTNETEVSRFSDVQSRGFLPPGADLASWHAFLHAANRRNMNHPAQRFYVGYIDGVAVTVALMVVNDTTAGVYAVATLPDRRSRGYSRALLVRAMLDAHALGCNLLTLQVQRGSNAERLYRRLGFAVDFDCTLWEKKHDELVSNEEKAS